MSTAQPELRATYAIVGAGVFGASTALHLSRQHPDATIYLIDREPHPSRRAASWDWNKVVRADYADPAYMALGLEAARAWASDPLLAPLYHESGTLWIADGDFARVIAGNYARLGATTDHHHRPEVVDPDEARRRYGGLFAGADYSRVTQVLVNPSGGWAPAKEALRAVVDAAVGAGVVYLQGNVDLLRLDSDGSCTGLRLSNGTTVTASNVILSTGANTARLLADSAPDSDDFQVGDRMVAAAICTGLVKLGPEDAEKYRRGPVCCQHLLPGRGGSLPPTRENYLKFWVDIPFRNTLRHSSGREISMPPDEPDYAQWEVSQVLKDEVLAVNRGVFGLAGSDFSIEEHRICWDAVTPTGDFLVSPHPASKNLFIATAGSFHGWKFLPILGKYVVQMMEGTLVEELKQRWSWRREAGDPKANDMWPRRELRNLGYDVEALPKDQRSPPCI